MTPCVDWQPGGSKLHLMYGNVVYVLPGDGCERPACRERD